MRRLLVKTIGFRDEAFVESAQRVVELFNGTCLHWILTRRSWQNSLKTFIQKDMAARVFLGTADLTSASRSSFVTSPNRGRKGFSLLASIVRSEDPKGRRDGNASTYLNPVLIKRAVFKSSRPQPFDHTERMRAASAAPRARASYLVPQASS